MCHIFLIIVESKRHCSDPEYIPTWKQSGHWPNNTITCMYPGCVVTCSPLGERIITPSEETLPIFAKALNVKGDISLCETHYQTIYRQSHKSNPCVRCGAKAREGVYTRYSPDTTTVSEYLCNRTGSDPNILPTDSLCKGCYDMHLVILNHIEQQANEPGKKLQSLVIIWEEKMRDENTNELTGQSLPQ